MEDRLYLVTFERIDPFFVIDLSADRPRVLGELKIPGFSNYLHPYDENHIIGIGKETVDESGWIREIGVKLALFDVSDVRNPAVLDQTVIGSEGTYSAALHSHKAFLFDLDRNLLSIPISGGVPELFGSESAARDWDRHNWHGFFVYALDKRDGFELRGTIDHSESMDMQPDLARSLYIGDVLYTISADIIRMHVLDDIGTEINSIDIGPGGQIIEYVN